MRKNLAFVFLLAVLVYAQPEMDPKVMDNGGGKAESTSYNIDASIGKSIIGRSDASETTLRAGFITILANREAVEEHQKPSEIRIGGIYPNPFNSAANIDIYLDGETLVKVDIFDLLGNSIYSHEIRKKPGNWTIRFDPPQGMSSGIYLYRISAGEKTSTDKMIYIK